MNNKLIKEVAARLASVSFSAENARIADMRADIERMQVAIQKAEERCSELSRAKVMESGPNARAVADALLAEVAPIDAAARATNPEDMDAELANLRAAMGDLRRRIDDTNRAILSVEGEAATRLRPIVQPLVDDILGEARRAGEQIREAYAALAAISSATRTIISGESDIREVAHALTYRQNALNYSTDIEVPGELVDALSNLAGKGAAHRPHLRSIVHTR
jgi:hypothetical protein